MASFNTNKKKFLFPALLLALAAAITIIVLQFFQIKNAKPKVITDTSTIYLIKYTEVLQKSFNELRDLNYSYSLLITKKKPDSADLKTIDSLNTAILYAENDFSKVTDSLKKNAKKYDEAFVELFNKIVSVYTVVLNQNHTLDNIRKSFAAVDTSSASFDRNALVNLQNELQMKELDNISLSNKLYNSQKIATMNSPDSFKQFLRQQDTVLGKVLETQKERSDNLIAYNDRLKRENVILKNQLDQLSNATTLPKTIDISAETKEQLNAQVSLAKADCFLLRADTKQIISNSKQRKELLENALQILNQLSQSKNSSIQHEVELRMNQLKTIASNNHD